MSGIKEISLRFDFGDWHVLDVQQLTLKQIANMRDGTLEEVVVKAMFDRLYRVFLDYRGKRDL